MKTKTTTPGSVHDASVALNIASLAKIHMDSADTLSDAGETMPASETPHEEIRRHSWRIADLLDGLDPHVEYMKIRASSFGHGAVTTVFDDPMGDKPAAKQHSFIPDIYSEWLAILNGPADDRTDEEFESEPSRYQVLQELVLHAEPRSPQDVAMMFLMDTDNGQSFRSEEFDARIREIAESGPSDVTPDPLLEKIRAYQAGLTAFCAIPEEELVEDEDGFVAATYGPAQDAMMDKVIATTSMEGACEALRLAIEEKGGGTMHLNLLRAALAYLDGRTAGWES